MGAKARAHDLIDWWANLPGEERLICRIRLGDPPVTLQVTDVSYPSEGQIMVRGYELAGALAHTDGIRTEEGGLARPARAKMVDPADWVEILDMDEPNEPGAPPPEPETEPSDVGVPDEFIDHRRIDLGPEGGMLYVPDKIEMVPHTNDPALADAFMDQLAHAMSRPLTEPPAETLGREIGERIQRQWEPTADRPPAFDQIEPQTPPVGTPQRSGRLLATSVPIKDWSTTSPLKLPTELLTRLNDTADERMIGRRLLLAILVEEGLNRLDRDGGF